MALFGVKKPENIPRILKVDILRGRYKFHLRKIKTLSFV
jgi:hypothetical protein